jgi:DNA-binding transcriptional LysR family regulator
MTTRRGRPPGRREGEVTLGGLKSFVAVAEAQSFSGAAAALGVSQPTVSVQLAALEQACGVLLFHRKPQLTLTEAGADLFVRARLALSRVGEFEASARDLRTMQRGHLTLGLSTPHVALPILSAFMRTYPSVTVATSVGNTAELLEDVGKCRVDIGIMTLVEPPPNLACTLISAPRLALCMRHDDPLAGRTALHPRDVKDRGFIMREDGSMTRVVLEKAFAAHGVTPTVCLVLGSREAIKEAVAEGMGLGAIFENEVGPDPRLAKVALATAPVAHGVYAVCLKEALDIPAVRAFIDGLPGGENRA